MYSICFVNSYAQKFRSLTIDSSTTYFKNTVDRKFI